MVWPIGYWHVGVGSLFGACDISNEPSDNLLLVRLSILKLLKKGNGVQEGAFTCGHHNLDGIEISGAGEATSEVSCRIDSGIELSTCGTNEPLESLSELGWDLEV